MLDRGQPAGLWYHPAPVRRFLIAVDFDGTITQHDTLHLIVDRFGDPSGEAPLMVCVCVRHRLSEMHRKAAVQPGG